MRNSHRASPDTPKADLSSKKASEQESKRASRQARRAGRRKAAMQRRAVICCIGARGKPRRETWIAFGEVDCDATLRNGEQESQLQHNAACKSRRVTERHEGEQSGSSSDTADAQKSRSETPWFACNFQTKQSSEKLKIRTGNRRKCKSSNLHKLSRSKHTTGW